MLTKSSGINYWETQKDETFFKIAYSTRVETLQR